MGSLTHNDSHSLTKHPQKQLLSTIILASTVLAGKTVGIFTTNSLALFSNLFYLVLGLVILILNANFKYTYKFYKCDSLITNICLIIISLFILYNALLRYLNNTSVLPGGIIIFSIYGLLINSIIVRNLQGHYDNTTTEKLFSFLLSDALVNIGMLIGGVVIYFTGWHGIDSLLSIILASLILKTILPKSLQTYKMK